MGISGIYPLVMTNIAIENNCFEYFLMGKSTISMAMFHSYVTNYQRVCWNPRNTGMLTIYLVVIRMSQASTVSHDSN